MAKDKTTYVVIQDWMLKLGLDLTETVVFAIIYGFSQDGETTFHGSWKYLQDHALCSRAKVARSLKHLVELRYIAKADKYVNGIKFCEYYAEVGSGNGTGFGGGITEILPVSNRDKVVSYSDRGSVSARPNKIIDKKDNSKAANNAHTREATPAPKNFDYKSKLIQAGVSPENAERLMANRKSAGLKNTEAAYNKLMGALEQVCNGYGVTTDEAIAFAGKKGWGFIDPSWNLEGLRAQSPRARKALSIDQLLDNEFGHADK